MKIKLAPLFAMAGLALIAFQVQADSLVDGSADAGKAKALTCTACHGPEGKAPVMTEYPLLAGQNADYLLNQMQDIKNGARGNSHTAPMKNVMHLISDEEMAIIANWLAQIE